MKSTTTRIIAAIMALVMIATCFAGCDLTKEEDETGSTKPTVQGPSNKKDSNDETTTGDDTTTTTSSTTTTTKPSTTTTTKPSTGTGGGSLSTQDMNEILNSAGYVYDAEQDIFYSTLNPWQRHFGFGSEYDQAAPYANMTYTTIKADFDYDGLKWRLQWWKGQYGVLVGAELGVYTKDPNDNSTTFYECASDEHLLDMSFEFYKSGRDYKAGNRLFYREEQAHWWLTGFKFGSGDPRNFVVVATLKAFDSDMADAIETGFARLTGAGAGREKFVKRSTLDANRTKADYYVRDGNTFTVVWQNAGFENYS